MLIAGKDLIAGRPAKTAPELADWSCFACHHDLGPSGTDVRPKYRSLKQVGEPSDPFDRVSELFGADRSPLSVLIRQPFDEDDPNPGRKLVAALRLPERYAAGELDRINWDDAAQTYYALRAAKRPAIAADLDRLAEKLRLPRVPAVVNSPVNYDPKAVAKLLAEGAEKGAK